MTHRYALLLLSLVALLLFPSGSLAQDSVPEPAESAGITAEASGFERIVLHYELIRVALLHDTVEGIATEARAIRAIVDELETDWSAERAGVHPEVEDDARGLLPKVAAAADLLSEPHPIEETRDHFFELSVPMLALQKAAEGATSIVAYCPMADRSWLQPAGTIGNPYFGQEMAQCGTVLEE